MMANFQKKTWEVVTRNTGIQSTHPKHLKGVDKSPFSVLKHLC